MINPDGLVLIGVGSEWFWSAAQFAVVTVTLIGLYRQLRAQNAANVVQRMESLQGAWDSPRIVYSRLAVATWLRDHPGAAPDFDDQVSLAWLCNFLENLSDLEEDGSITWREIENTWGQTLVSYWSVLEPVIANQRVVTGTSRMYLGFERLARRAAAAAARLGEDWTLRDDDRAAFLASQIGRNAARLRLLTAIERGTIPDLEKPGEVQSGAVG